MSARQKESRHDRDCARDHEVLIASPRNACDCGLEALREKVADAETFALAIGRAVARTHAMELWATLEDGPRKTLTESMKAVCEAGAYEEERLRNTR